MVRGSAAREYRAQHRRHQAFIRREARRAMDASRDTIREFTPVGRRRDPKTGMDMGPSGRLRKSVIGIRPHQIRSRRPGEIVYRTGAHSELRIASLIEGGAVPHMIFHRRKKALRFWNMGGEWFARYVEHPGFEGRHMFAIGINAALARQMAGAEIRWRVEVFRG